MVHLVRAGHIKTGDRVCFELSSSDYTVTGVSETGIGMIRHQHNGGSSSYWPDELLYVEDEYPTSSANRDMRFV